jgi:hypothetical protein
MVIGTGCARYSMWLWLWPVRGKQTMLKGKHISTSQRQIPVRSRSLAGQVMLLVTIALVALLGMAGLATDAGLLWTEKGQIQTAADAAAVAGALAVVSGGNVTSAVAWRLRHLRCLRTFGIGSAFGLL